MPILDEDTALSLADRLSTTPPEKYDPLEVKSLQDYKRHQTELGLPLFPVQEAKQRELDAKYRSIFMDVKMVDEFAPSMKQVTATAPNPDLARQTFANSLFLSRELGKSVDEVQANYNEWMGGYSQKVWGKRVADTAGFYGMAQGHVKKQVEMEEAGSEAMRLAITSAALGTNDSVGDYQKWKASNAGKAPTVDAHRQYSAAYNQVKARIEPYKPVVAGAVKALKQLMSGEGATDGTEQRIVDAIVDLPPQDRPLVLASIMAGAQATGEGADKEWTFWQQTGEAFSRLLKGSYAGISSSKMDTYVADIRRQIEAGGEVPMEGQITDAESARKFLETSFQREISATTSGIGFGDPGVTPTPRKGVERKLTDEERRLLNSELNRVQRQTQITRQIEQAAVSTDPVKNVFASAIGSSLAILPASAMGPGGVLVAAQAYSGMEYDKLRVQYPTMTPRAAQSVAGVSGVVMAGLDKLEVDFLTDKLPSLRNLIGGGVMNSVLKRMGVRAAEGFVFENVQEGLQDLSTPVVQEIATRLNEDIPELDWNQEWAQWSEGRADVALGTLPLVLIGVGAAAYNDVTGAAEMLKQDKLLQQFGLPEADRVSVVDLAAKGDMEGAQAALRDAYLRRDPAIAAAAAKSAPLEQQATQRFDSLLFRLAPKYSQEGDTHTLTFPDGRVVKAESWSEARWYMEQAMGDTLSQEVDAVAKLGDFFISQQREGVNETMELNPKKRTMQQDVEEGIITEEQARERAAIAGEAFGLTPEEAQKEVWTVLGRNTVDTQTEVANSAIQLFEGADVNTVVEEVVEGRWKAALAQGKYSAAQAKQFIAQVESATGEKFLEADTDQGITEAISAIVVADVLGRRKDGTQLPAGLVTRGMLAAVQRQATPKANRRLMGMVAAFRSFFRQVFARAKALNKAKGEGKLGKEYQGFVDELLGVDPQVRELNVAATEARAMATGEAKTEEVSTKQANQMKGLGVVRYAGVTGRLERLGERYVIKPKTGPEVELSGEDFVDVVFETDPATLEEFNKPEPVESDGRTGAPTVEPTTGFTPARDGTLAITTPDGRTLVPVKRELSKNIVKNRRGTGFKLKDAKDKYGDRIVTLYGAEATQAIDAMLEAAANVEGMGRKVSYSLGRAVPQDSSNVTVMPDGARLVGPTTYSIRAFHGTPHKVDKFATAKVGTGEGAQAYGWGLYFAESKGIANFYKETLSRTADGSNTPTYKGANASVWRSMRGMPEQSDVLYILALMEQQKFSAEQALDYAKDDIESDLQATDFVVPTEGNLYTVNLLPNEEEFLDWDKPLSEQSQKIQDELFVEFGELYSPDKTGGEWYREMTQDDTDPQTLSKDLARIGIPGFKYLDATSRDGGSGTSNFVIFDESLVEILEENGQKVSYSLGRATPQDTEYLAAVERGDMATAQRMVDAKLRDLGSLTFSAKGSYTLLDPILGRINVYTSAEREVTSRQWQEAPTLGDLMRDLGEIRGKQSGLKVSSAPDAKNQALLRPRIMLVDGYALDRGDVASEVATAKAQGFGSIVEIQDVEAVDGLIYEERADGFYVDENTDELVQVEYDSQNKRLFTRDEVAEVTDDLIARTDLKHPGVRIITWGDTSTDPITLDEQGNVVPLSQRFDPQPNRTTYALAPAKFSDQVMTELEQQLGKDPAQRWAMAMEIVRRISKLRTEVDEMAAADLTATQRKDQRAQFVRDKFDELVAQMPPNQSVDELKKVMAQAEKEGDAWAAQNKADAPGQRERIIGYQRIVNAALMGLPKPLRTDIGGFLQVADARSATTALKAIKGHIGKIGDTVERYLKEEFQTEVKALIKRGKPNLKPGEKPSGTNDIGAEASNLFQVAADAIKMDEVQTLRAIADREAEILDPNNKPTPEREQQLRDEINIINLAGDLKNATAAESKALLDTLQEIYDGGYLIRLARENQKRAMIERLKDLFKTSTGLTTPREIEAALAKMRARGKAAVWWDTLLLELGSFNDLIYKLAGQDSEFAREILNMERKADNMVHDLNDAMEQDVADFFTRLAGSEIKGQHLRAAMSLNTKKGKLWLGVNKAGQPPVKHTLKIPGKPDAVEFTSQMEAIHDLMMWRQPDGKRSMGGKFDTMGNRTSTWGYDDAWAQETMNQLTPESWQLMDWLTQQYQDEYAVLDPLVRDRLGVMLPQNPLYSPLTNASAQVQAGQMTNPVTGAAVTTSMGITPPALKNRNKSINKPRKGDALKVFMVHSRQMNHWIANYDFARTMQQLFLGREMLDYVEAVGGEAAVKMILARVDMAVVGGMRDSGVQLAIDGALKDAAGRGAASAILGRVSTLAVQSTQLFASSMKMPQATFLRLFGKLSAGQLDWNATRKSQFIQRRIAQKSPLVQEAMRGLLNATSPSLIKNQQRRLAELLAGTDAYFTAATHTMIYHYQLEVADGLGMTGAEAQQFAMDEADRLTEEVAQPVRQSQRSLLELRNSQTWAGRVGWSFASEARQKLAILMVAADKVKTDPSWNNIGELARVANYVFMINGLLVQMWKRSWLLARTPGGDDEDFEWKNILLSSLASPLTGAPGWQALADTGNMLSAGVRSGGAVKRMISTIAGEDQPYDGDPVQFMKDAELILGAMSLFSDTAATLSGYSHLATDLAKLFDAQTED